MSGNVKYDEIKESRLTCCRCGKSFDILNYSEGMANTDLIQYFEIFINVHKNFWFSENVENKIKEYSSGRYKICSHCMKDFKNIFDNFLNIK